MVMWKWLYLNVNYSHCIDPILYTVESLESDSKVNLVTDKNYDHADWITITLGAQKNVKLGHEISWTPQYNISLMKPWLKAEFLGEQKSFNQPMLSLQLGNIVTLSHDWLVQADFNVHVQILSFRLVSARTSANVALTSSSQAMTFSMEASIASRSIAIA